MYHLEIFNRELSDTIMNVVGAFMWVSVGATALHYWQGFMADHDQLGVNYERTVNESVLCAFFNIRTHDILINTIGWFGARFLVRTRGSIVCD